MVCPQALKMTPELLATLHPDTLAVRQAMPRSAYGEHSEALYLTSGYVQPSAEVSARRFGGLEEGYTYGRSSNPTVTSFEQRLAALEGELPSPLAPPAGCRFHPRCPKAKDICRQEAPQWKELGTGWRVRCWLA